MIEEIEKEVRTDLSIHIANLNWLIQDLQYLSLEDKNNQEKYKIKMSIQDTRVLKDLINNLNNKKDAIN